MELIKIQVTVNGREEILDVSPNLSLLNMLRENLALTGTKSGCEAGECGACTVLLEREPVNSCMVLAVECNGLSVETIEGLSEKEAMKNLQNAFMDLNAIQCGFCTPGMLISAFALLKRNPDPNDEEIRGYERIINAVKKAARKQERFHGN